ncbi:MAG: hypothetical protein C5S49_07095 [Candidatus Methanogaster sp.]|nr:MAG: hypothetical protein C5S49_07095 [ANME-2 cluster archaeon]
MSVVREMFVEVVPVERVPVGWGLVRDGGLLASGPKRYPPLIIFCQLSVNISASNIS